MGVKEKAVSIILKTAVKHHLYHPLMRTIFYMIQMDYSLKTYRGFDRQKAGQ